MLPVGKLGNRHANFEFSPEDFRFTIGKNSLLYAFYMTGPSPGTVLNVKSLSTENNYWKKPVQSVRLLGHDGELQWSQDADGLTITCPDEMPFETSIVFEAK